jgi:hypothetical protein
MAFNGSTDLKSAAYTDSDMHKEKPKHNKMRLGFARNKKVLNLESSNFIHSAFS